MDQPSWSCQVQLEDHCFRYRGGEWHQTSAGVSPYGHLTRRQDSLEEGLQSLLKEWGAFDDGHRAVVVLSDESGTAGTTAPVYAGQWSIFNRHKGVYELKWGSDKAAPGTVFEEHLLYKGYESDMVKELFKDVRRTMAGVPPVEVDF